MTKTKNTKIVFVGGRERGLECIKELIKRKENLVHIFCMVEDTHEKEKFSSEIERFAKHEKIPISLTGTVKKPEYINLLRKINPDLIIVAGWRTIIPKEVLDIPKLGTIAAHESLLPKYRGFAPINWVVINGGKVSGVSLFYLDEGMDSGNIIEQGVVKISNKDTTWDVYQKAKRLSLKLIFDNLDKIKKGRIKGRRQNEKEATYTCSRIPEDGKICWDWNVKRIHNFVRGLAFPYPGAFTTYNGTKVIINKAEIITNPKKYIGYIPGRVVSFSDKSVDVLVNGGILRINEISLDGKKVINPRDLVNSIKGTFGR